MLRRWPQPPSAESAPPVALPDRSSMPTIVSLCVSSPAQGMSGIGRSSVSSSGPVGGGSASEIRNLPFNPQAIVEEKKNILSNVQHLFLQEERALKSVASVCVDHVFPRNASLQHHMPLFPPCPLVTNLLCVKLCLYTGVFVSTCVHHSLPLSVRVCLYACMFCLSAFCVHVFACVRV